MSGSTSEAIPFAKLGVPLDMEARIGRDSPSNVKRAIAKGVVPVPATAQLGVLYVLATDPDPKVASAARKTLRGLPDKLVLTNISMRTHPKILEFITEFRRPTPETDERIAMLRVANDRTVELIAARANSSLCEMLSRNHERLLMSPGVFVALHANPQCSDTHLASAEAFLRMQDGMPEVPEVRPFLQAAGSEEFVSADDGPVESDDASSVESDEDADSPESDAGNDAVAPAPFDPADVDIEAEVDAALRGEVSPTLVRRQEEALRLFDLSQLDVPAEGRPSGFKYDFADVADTFSFDLTGDHSETEAEERGELSKRIDQQIKDMSVGQKIKLAFLGNKEVRSYLIRDRNRIVASAVVKSGRLTDSEVTAFAGNKNLDSDVIREICNNREWMRKYPIKVALANNPKTPVGQAVAAVAALQKKDLLMLTRNRNVPSVVNQAAVRLYRQKFKDV